MRKYFVGKLMDSGRTELWMWIWTIMISILIVQYASVISAQELNEPARNYIESRLGNRRIWWCPSGYGYLSFCPQPTDWDGYNWCCTWPYMGTWKPACCPYAIPTGAVVAVIMATILTVILMTALSCWCCFCCPLYKEIYDD